MGITEYPYPWHTYVDSKELVARTYPFSTIPVLGLVKQHCLDHDISQLKAVETTNGE